MTPRGVLISKHSRPFSSTKSSPNLALSAVSCAGTIGPLLIVSLYGTTTALLLGPVIFTTAIRAGRLRLLGWISSDVTNALRERCFRENSTTGRAAEEEDECGTEMIFVLIRISLQPRHGHGAWAIGSGVALRRSRAAQ